MSTNRASMDLYNAFNRLEKLCNDQYGQIHGVTLYIDDMKNTSSYRAQKIPGWNDDLRRLIHVRHIRNQLAHDPGAFDFVKVTAEDIEFLENFYRRILAQTDPLSRLAKAQPANIRRTAAPHAQHNKKGRSYARTDVLRVFAWCLIALTIIVLLFLANY